jgi:molybdopterin converting factor small subunit
MNINNYNINFQSDKIKNLTIKASKLFSENGPFIEPTELILRNNTLEIKSKDYIFQNGDEIYIFEKNSGINSLKLKV